MKCSILIVLFFQTLLFAAESSAPDPAQFELDKDLVNTLYKQSVENTAVAPSRISSGLNVEAQFVLMQPTTLALTNQYFGIDYANSFSSIPAFQLSVGYSLSRYKAIELSAVGKVGYGRKEAITTIRSASGGQFRDSIQLNWLPLSAGIRAQLITSDTAIVKPFLEAGLGVQWIFQSGKLDKSLEQGFWIPFYQASLGFNLFGSRTTAADWFGGITLGASLRRSIASSQIANSWSADMGITLFL